MFVTTIYCIQKLASDIEVSSVNLISILLSNGAGCKWLNDAISIPACPSSTSVNDVIHLYMHVVMLSNALHVPVT